MARQGGRVLRTGTDPKASQNISTFIACLVLLLLLLSLLLFSLFFKQVYAHTDSIYLSASKLLVITLRIIKYSLPQEEPSESPPVKKLA